MFLGEGQGNSVIILINDCVWPFFIYLMIQNVIKFNLLIFLALLCCISFDKVNIQSPELYL